MASEWIITPRARLSFPSLFTPQADDDGKLWYKATFIFEKDVDLEALKKAAFNEAANKLKGGAKEAKELFARKSGGLRWPFRDGSEKEHLGYPTDGVFINTKTKQKPGVVDQNVEDIIDPGELYAGCYVRAQVSPLLYDAKGNRGVTFFLGSVQKLGDGERMAGAPSAKSVFSVVGDDETVKTENTSPDEFDDILG